MVSTNTRHLVYFNPFYHRSSWLAIMKRSLQDLCSIVGFIYSGLIVNYFLIKFIWILKKNMYVENIDRKDI